MDSVPSSAPMLASSYENLYRMRCHTRSSNGSGLSNLISSCHRCCPPFTSTRRCPRASVLSSGSRTSIVNNPAPAWVAWYGMVRCSKPFEYVATVEGGPPDAWNGCKPTNAVIVRITVRRKMRNFAGFLGCLPLFMKSPWRYFVDCSACVLSTMRTRGGTILARCRQMDTRVRANLHPVLIKMSGDGHGARKRPLPVRSAPVPIGHRRQRHCSG